MGCPLSGFLALLSYTLPASHPEGTGTQANIWDDPAFTDLGMCALRFQSLRKLQRLSEYMGSVGVDGGQGDADPEFGDYDDHEQLGVSGFGDTAYSTCHTSGIAGGVPGCDFSTGSPFWVSKVRVEYLQDSYRTRAICGSDANIRCCSLQDP